LDTPGDRRTILRAALALAIAAFGYLISFPPTLNSSDEALFLYGAKRILNGQALYRDIFEFITPAGFYFFALVYAVAGTTLQAARAAMTAVDALAAALVYVLARKVAGSLEALLAAVVFTVACLPVWNLSSPHWLSTCICLASAAVLLSDRWAGSARLRPFLAGALAGLSFSTQQQRGVFLGIWLVIALVLLPGGGTAFLRVRAARALAWAATGWAGVVVPIVGYAVWRSSPAEFVRAIFTHVVSVYGPTFVGFTRWGGLTWVTEYVADYTWPWVPRLLPVAIALESCALLVRIVGHRSRSEALRAALLALAGCMAGSVFYFPDLIHVSFIVVFSLVVAAGLVYRARSGLGRGLAQRLVQVVLLVAIALALHKGWQTIRLVRSENPVRYETAFGTIAGTEGHRRTFERLQAAVAGVPAGRRIVFSYPNDASLYLTLPGENPTPFALLVPGYNTAEQFRTAFDALERRRADYVIVGILLVKPGDPLMKFLDGRYERQVGVNLGGVAFVYTPVPP
jgi:hypothetical protein